MAFALFFLYEQLTAKSSVEKLNSIDILEQIKKEWPDINSDKWHKGHEYIDGRKNILEQGMRSISKLAEVPTFTSKVLKYILFFI